MARTTLIARALALFGVAWMVWAQTAAIPDPVALLNEVQEHQRKTDPIRENYTFHEIVRTDSLDAKGAVTETRSEESEVFLVNGHRIIRLVKKNGVELSAKEQ